MLWTIVDERRQTKCALDLANERPQLHLLTTSDVIHLSVERSVRVITWFTHVRNNTLYAVDDIVDIREISFHLSIVEQCDGVSLDDVLGEIKQRHVRSTPWSIHGEESHTNSIGNLGDMEL